MFKKIISLVLVCSIIMSSGVTIMAASSYQETLSYEKAYELATIINNNLSYIEQDKKFVFDKDVAIGQGLDIFTANQLDNYYETLNSEEAEYVYKEIKKIQEESSVSPAAVPSIIVSAAKILAKAGLSWLAKKLLDWGSEKFCTEYKYYNSLTKNVCDFLGE